MKTEAVVEELPWATWAAQEADRSAWLRQYAERMIRPSIELPAELVARCDRIAAVQGMTRGEYITAALVHYQAHWRPCPNGGE